MNCDEARQRLADRLTGALEPAARGVLDEHLAACDGCRTAASEAAEGLEALEQLVTEVRAEPVPPMDIGALLRSGRRRAPMRVLGTAVRVAAVLLAAIGVLALLRTRVEVGDGVLEVAFTLPGHEPAPEPAAVRAPGEESREDTLEVVDQAVLQALRPQLTEMATWMVDRERERTEQVELLAEWLDRRRQADAELLAGQLFETQRRLDDTQRAQEVIVRAIDARPVRFEPR